MKIVYCGNRAFLKWFFVDAITGTDFVFDKADVELSIKSCCCREEINCMIEGNVISAEIPSCKLPCGVYSLELRYWVGIGAKRSKVVIDNAFQVTNNRYMQPCTSQLEFTSIAMPIFTTKIATIEYLSLEKYDHLKSEDSLSKRTMYVIEKEDGTADIYIYKYPFTSGEGTGDVPTPGDSVTADNEDLVITYKGNSRVFKFKDRDTSKGKGYIILRTGKSLAEQMTQENTIYEVRYDFDLNGGILEIPSNCILDFKGGKFINGEINFNECIIDSNKHIAIFENIAVHGLKEIYADWFEGSKGDLTPLLSINGVLHLGENTYNANVSNLILSDISIIGENKNTTILQLTESKASSYLLGLGKNVKIDNLHIINDHTFKGDVIRMSNEFVPAQMSNPNWSLSNINISTRFYVDDYESYYATAIAIYCRDKNDEGVSILNDSGEFTQTNALSYLRDFRNICIRYYKIGINVLIKQELSLPEKIWCNSFLFENLVIWAKTGIQFMSATTDSDSGNFTFSNYMYQGKEGTYGYYTDDGKENVLINYLPWDTRNIGYVEKGELIVTNLTKQDANRFSGNGMVYSNFGSKRLFVKGSTYDSSTGQGRFAIGSENRNEVEIVQDVTSPVRTKFRNKNTQLLDASISQCSYSGDEVIRENYNVIRASDYGRNGYLVEHSVSLYSTYDGSTIDTILASKPYYSAKAEVRQFQYNTISIICNVGGFSIQPFSVYRIYFTPKDAFSKTVDLSDNYTSISASVLTNLSYRNYDRHLQITGSRILRLSESTEGNWIEVRNNSKYTLSNICLKFEVSGTGNNIARSHVTEVDFRPELWYKLQGTFSERESSKRYVGEMYICTDLNDSVYVPIFNMGSDVWVDSIGRIIDSNYSIVNSGNTNSRPTLGSKQIGFYYYDTSINKPIYWNGTKWVDNTGNDI